MKGLVSLCLLVMSLLVNAQTKMNSSEIGYLYDLEHQFLLDHRIASDQDNYKIFLRFTLNSGNVKTSDYKISYDLRSNYMSDKSVNTVVSLDSAKIINKGFREIIYQLEFERANGQELAVVEVFNIPKNRRFRYDIPLLVDGYTPPPFLIYEPFKNIPYFNAYINKGSQIRLGNVFKNQDSFEINGRTSNALTPIPPFDEKNRMPPKNNPIDTLYGAVQNELFTFYNEGVYHINSATNPDKKLAIYVADEYYPYFGAYDKMITPLIFLSTNEEYQNMTLATDQRIGFENFVRETISGNDQIAKDFIKYYYRRIRKSARLFTEDREGWKTDRGMIYQIFGDPLQVFRNEKNELWVYSNSSGNRLRFTFDIEFEDGIKKHRLVRGKRYKEDWMTAVTQWRSGRIIE